MSIADVGQRTENSFALRDSLWRVFALNVGKTQLTEKRHRGRRQQTADRRTAALPAKPLHAAGKRDGGHGRQYDCSGNCSESVEFICGEPGVSAPSL
jgi:hypothetical protein